MLIVMEKTRAKDEPLTENLAPVPVLTCGGAHRCRNLSMGLNCHVPFAPRHLLSIFSWAFMLHSQVSFQVGFQATCKAFHFPVGVRSPAFFDVEQNL